MMQRLATFFVLSVLSPAILAASFDCKKASTAGEKAICADATLSKLDEQLAQAYRQALKKGSRAQVQAAQKAWLKEQRSCGADRFCLEGKYNIRIAQLEGAHWSLADWQRASGTWTEADSGMQSLTIKSMTEDGFQFELSSSAGSYGGTIDGQARFTPDGALFTSSEDGVSCQLRFFLQDKGRLSVEDIDTGVVDSDHLSCVSYYGRGSAEFGGTFRKGGHGR